MTSDRDTYRTALDYLERHGDTAPIHAAMEADARLEVSVANIFDAAQWPTADMPFCLNTGQLSLNFFGHNFLTNYDAGDAQR